MYDLVFYTEVRRITFFIFTILIVPSLFIIDGLWGIFSAVFLSSCSSTCPN